MVWTEGGTHFAHGGSGRGLWVQPFYDCRGSSTEGFVYMKKKVSIIWFFSFWLFTRFGVFSCEALLIMGGREGLSC